MTDRKLKKIIKKMLKPTIPFEVWAEQHGIDLTKKPNEKQGAVQNKNEV